MSDITLRNNIVYESNIGAIICRTPKLLNDYTDNDGLHIDRHCILCENTDDLLKYFGDPFIDPSSYSDLTIAYDLLRRNVRMYISSIDEMKHNNDGFNITYNGYTEFYFLDKNGNNTIGYRLKSDIKFCQPIIQSAYKLNNLEIYVSLYYLNRSKVKHRSDINKIDESLLYTTYRFSFNATKDNDKSIIDALSNIGVELQILNSYSDKSFIEELKKHSTFNIVLDQSRFNSIDLGYKYNLNTENYNYNFSEEDVIIDHYTDAIGRLCNKNPEPLYICLSKLYKSVTVYSDDNIPPKYIVRSSMDELDTGLYYVVQSILLNNFTDDSNIYLFISAPDISVSSLYKWMTDEYYKVELPDQFNCDIYYGYIIEYILDSTYYQKPHRILLSASVLTMYNLLLSNESYIANSIGNLNIANASVKSIISESTAKKFLDYRCNSIVTFDKGTPSIYGDRSLSLLPHLRYSHVSRNIVLIRRLVRQYLDTQKFSLNTTYNVDSYVTYIKSRILEQFIIDGIIDKYNVTKSIKDKTVYISIDLYFSKFIESINLDFTI